MNSSMINAMVSMNGLQRKLDVLADNIANQETVGYKRKEASFADLLHSSYEQPESFSQPGRMTPLGFRQGWGSRLASVRTDFEQGVLKETGVKTDMAIDGNAWFQVETGGEEQYGYTRNGSFQLTPMPNGDTILATEQGYPVVSRVYDPVARTEVDGRIVVPNGFSVKVSSDGTVTAENEAGETMELGRIKLMQATSPAALTATADNLFIAARGEDGNELVREVNPDAEGIAVKQGFLEQSNVDLSSEITELINVQRAYQLAARALTSSDTMMNLANNMRA
ncbi:flagellar hook-basal body protein [Paenibacillus thailandensis]|uniref:Flagellar hook-basal body protein n=1 Tax=Paenibacillus thailandensis TaxID=393250 RepID=A0ABW5R6D9_9BACL